MKCYAPITVTNSFSVIVLLTSGAFHMLHYYNLLLFILLSLLLFNILDVVLFVIMKHRFISQNRPQYDIRQDFYNRKHVYTGLNCMSIHD